MYNVSFGKMTPRAESAANIHIEAWQTVVDKFKTRPESDRLKAEKKAFESAKNNPDYLFDINPIQIYRIDENGQPKFNDSDSFTLYRIGKGNDKYCYLGKFSDLQQGVKLADDINSFLKHYKNHKSFWLAPEKVLSVKLRNFDKSLDLKSALEKGRKLLDLVG